MKKEKPFARCTRCRNYTTNDALINGRCPLRFIKTKNGKKISVGCKGVYKSLLRDDNLSECLDCSTEGIDCKKCNNVGWI